MQDDHLLPVSRPVPVNGRIPFSEFKRVLHQDNTELEVFEDTSSDSDED